VNNENLDSTQQEVDRTCIRLICSSCQVSIEIDRTKLYMSNVMSTMSDLLKKYELA